MAKRSTIGENPLDAVNQEHPLDTVVPDLSAVARTGRGQPPPEVDPRGAGAPGRTGSRPQDAAWPRWRGSKPRRRKRPP